MNTKKAHKESDWRTQERERAIGVIQRERVRPHKKGRGEQQTKATPAHCKRKPLKREKDKKCKGEEKV